MYIVKDIREELTYCERENIQHIILKYNLITFKAITFNQPSYLSSMIKSSDLTRGNRLSVSTFHPDRQIGHGSFQVSAHVEWNRLPPAVRSQTEITSFRNKLKTNLFRLAYPPL